MGDNLKPDFPCQAPEGREFRLLPAIWNSAVSFHPFGLTDEGQTWPPGQWA